jgi:hypothetical protein
MAGDTPMNGREQWRPARLIPTSGIRGQDEQESRATSSLLAVMQAVPEFGHALLAHIKAPAGRISTFTEVPFSDADGKRHRPDGAIMVERGKTNWCCLVEVKTGAAQLTVEQASRYLDIARTEGLHGVLTVSNQITRDANTSPFSIDGRRIRNLGLWHLSWWQILTDAIIQHRHRKIADPDQAWILGELIAYLDHENSGASGFTDMGEAWVAVRDGARNGTLSFGGKELPKTADRWEQFIQFLCLGLGQDLGRSVTPHRPRKQTEQARSEELVRGLVEHGKLTAAIRIPDAIAPLEIEADLRSRTVTTAVTLDLPRQGRATTRVNWVLRPLKDAPHDLRVTVAFANVRQTTSEMLSRASKHPELLLFSGDPKREPRSAQVALTQSMGSKRGRGQGSFAGETRQQVVEFYRDTVQSLKPWRAAAPKLPEPVHAVPSPPAQPDGLICRLWQDLRSGLDSPSLESYSNLDTSITSSKWSEMPVNADGRHG